MLVEILHTVRISIRSHVLVTEPFLVVGLIASIRRILVITLEAATLTCAGSFHYTSASLRSRIQRPAGTMKPGSDLKRRSESASASADAMVFNMAVAPTARQQSLRRVRGPEQRQLGIDDFLKVSRR